jgi:GAF domain-containing protein/HAMP domain-containing protein
MSDKHNRNTISETVLPPKENTQTVSSSIWRLWKDTLRTRLTLSFILAGVLPLVVTTVVVAYLSFSVQVPQVLNTQSQIAKRVAEQVKNFITQREQELRSLINVSELETLNLEEQTNLLNNLLSAHNLYDELILVSADGQEIIHISRTDVITSEQLRSRVGEDDYEYPKAAGKTYFGRVLFNDINGQPYQTISIPVYNLRSGKLVFVLIANFRFKTVWDIMADADVVGSGIVYMVDDTNTVIAHANPSITLQRTQVNLPLENGFAIGLGGENAAFARENVVLNDQVFSVVAEQPRSEALAFVFNNLIITIIITIIAIAGAVFLGSIIARRITNPIDNLAKSANQLTAGNLNVQVEIQRNDEIGTLATAFNSMASQLRALIGTLEQRVEERTRELEGRTVQLEAIADVARSIASIQEMEQLLPAITRLVSERFGFYHVGIFLLDEDHEYALLQAANSAGGVRMLARGHRLKVGQQGIVGYVTSQGVARIALDVGEEAVYFNNPDLPRTHSEVALPLKFGREIIGALDIQSTEPNAFTQEDVELFSTLADQVSVAIQNARSLEQAQRALHEAEVASRQLTGQAWRGYSEITLSKGYRYDGIKPEPLKKASRPSDEKEAATVPVQVRGQTIGRLKLKSSDASRKWTEDELAIIESTAERVAIAMDNARLLDEAQKRAARETFLSELAAKLGTTFQMGSILSDTVEELGQVLMDSTVTFQLVNPSAPPTLENDNDSSER